MMTIETMKLALEALENDPVKENAINNAKFFLRQSIAEAEKVQTADGWRQDGGLLYRLTDERSPKNRDEINVTMADGSRTLESCTRRAGELLDRIRNTAPPPRKTEQYQRREIGEGGWRDCTKEQYENARGRPEMDTRVITTPPRQPLTDEQRNWIVATCPTPRHIIDTVEKMHGIKENT